MTLPDPRTALDRLAGAETLLVCMDFDGTICPLGTDAYAVTPDPRALAALETLAGLPGTGVAILSGRHLDGLRRVCPLGPPVTLVGSHGAEPASGRPTLSDDDRAYLTRIQDELAPLIDAHPSAFIEIKPYQRVLHVAKLAATDPDTAASLLAQAREIPTDGRPVTPGHNVLEFSAVDITKGTWLAAEKIRYAATLFAGDDVTDETALAVLDTGAGAGAGPDVGVKVGPAKASGTAAASGAAAPATVASSATTTTTTTATAASHQLGSVAEVADFLTELAAARQSARG